MTVLFWIFWICLLFTHCIIHLSLLNASFKCYITSQWCAEWNWSLFCSKTWVGVECLQILQIYIELNEKWNIHYTLACEHFTNHNKSLDIYHIHNVHKNQVSPLSINPTEMGVDLHLACGQRAAHLTKVLLQHNNFLTDSTLFAILNV